MAETHRINHPPGLPESTRDERTLAAALLGAARAVAAVSEGRSLSDVLDPLASNRQAVQDLTYGTLRAYGRGDFFLDRLITRPLAHPLARALLWVALHRLETRPEEAHTVVDQSVDAAAAIARGRFKGLVNAVLRNFLRRRDELLAAAARDDVACYQHPRWWLKKLQRDYPEGWRTIALNGNLRPPLTLRVNQRRISRDGYLEKLRAEGIAAAAAGEFGVLLEKPVPVQRLPGFGAGLVSVQDLGAQLAAPLLDAQAGMRVLDACAAPGGKTTHLLELCDLDLLALDVDEARAALVRENIERVGLNARIEVADSRDLNAWWDGKPFDRILLDAPCSASGTVRRHPDAKWLRRPADLARFADRQGQLLISLWQALAADGKLLYATCSVFSEENERQVAAFAAGYSDRQRLMIEGAPACQLLPRAEHDGFYYALLHKRT